MNTHHRPGRPSTRAQRGGICSPHYLASSTGLDVLVLRDGGSAVDAAIAASATLRETRMYTTNSTAINQYMNSTVGNQFLSGNE